MSSEGIKGLLGPPVSFVDLLHHSLYDLSEREEVKVKNGTAAKGPFRPSSAGECERALAFKGMEYTGRAYYEKKLIEPHVQLIFQLGHSIEAMLMKAFEHVEFFETKYAQQTLTFFKIESGDKKIDQILEGSNDGCFVAKSGEWRGVFDVKSKAVGVGKFKRTKWDEFDCQLVEMKTVQNISETGWWIEDVEAFIKEVHDPLLAMNFWQLNLYCNSQFMLERGFDFASLIYFGKDDSRMRELRFKPSKSLADKVERRFQSAAKAVAASNPLLAKQEFLLGSSKCAFCPYVAPCWGVNERAALNKYFKDENLGNKIWPKDLDKDDPSMASVLLEFHMMERVEKDKAIKEDWIKQYMIDNNVTKLQVAGPTGDKLIYELKTYKTTTSLKRSKL